MRGKIESSVDWMMACRARAMIPTVLMLALGFIPIAFPIDKNLAILFWVGGLVVFMWLLPLWFILAEAVFRTGQIAFNSGAGVGYAALTIILTFFGGLGVFTVPLMVRADIQRLLGNPYENSDHPRDDT